MNQLEDESGTMKSGIKNVFLVALDIVNVNYDERYK
jgi:hypothetical protein